MNASIYLGGISYKIGQIIPVEDLNGPQEQKELLLSTGVFNVCKSNLSVQELAYHSIKGTLEKTTIDPSEVGALILATTSMSIVNNGEDYSLIDQVILDTGMTNAFPYGLFMSNCSNLTTAIKTAVSLLRDSDFDHVVVCVADKLKEDGDRFMGSNEAVLSDGAASVVVSKQQLEFKLKDIDIVKDFKYLTQKFNVLEFFQNNTENIKNLWQKMGGFDCEFDQVFFGNYNLLALRGFIAQLKLDKKKVFLKNVPQLGHVFSADQLINLDQYEAKQGENLALVTSGYFRWGVLFLEKL